MLMTIILSLAGPQACVDVKQQCRVCSTIGSKPVCSNIGIACQPLQRICRAGRDGKPAITRRHSPSATR